jgi:hypothetical protein
MTKAQNHLLSQVSLPSSDSPLNALLTRQNVESVNEETLETIRRVTSEVADLIQRIIQYPTCLLQADFIREQTLLEEVIEISDALKERLASLRTKSQQTASEYLAYHLLLFKTLMTGKSPIRKLNILYRPVF